MSTKWLAIIRSPGSPEKRLEKLMGLWNDCLHRYYAGTLQHFDDRYMAIVTPDQRDRIPVEPGNGSLIVVTNDQPSGVDKMMQDIIQDDRDMKLVRAFAEIFNENLDEEDRKLMMHKWFTRKTRNQICEELGMSSSTYHRQVKKAELILIMEYCLDFCDETGAEKDTWMDIIEDRKQWTGGVIREKDMFVYEEE